MQDLPRRLPSQISFNHTVNAQLNTRNALHISNKKFSVIFIVELHKAGTVVKNYAVAHICQSR